MIKRIFLIVLFTLLLVHLCSAEDPSLVFKQGGEVNYSFRCFDSDGDYCTSAANCIMSIEAPNGSNLYDNSSMTFAPTHFAFSLPTHTLGKYEGIVVCSSENITTAEFPYLITTSGQSLTEGRSSLYVGLLAVLAFLFVVTVIGHAKLPNGNVQEGELLHINKLKYLKPVLLVAAWLLLTSIIFTASNIAISYFTAGMFGQLLFSIYQIMMWLTLPMVIIWFVWIIVSLVRDKETRRMWERGVGFTGI